MGQCDSQTGDRQTSVGDSVTARQVTDRRQWGQCDSQTGDRQMSWGQCDSQTGDRQTSVGTV